MGQKIKTAVFIILLLAMLVPAVQQNTGLFRQRNLHGQSDPAAYPRFTLKSWFSDEFQVQFNKATEENVGFRPGLIRMKNELEYAIYRKANASGVVVGKKRYVFESDYIRSYTGRDYLGNYFWTQKFNRLAMVRDTLAKLGVKMAIVLEPGKATSYPELIPKAFLKFKSDSTNYGAILRESGKRRIPLLDLNRYFAQQKPAAGYPLFPKGGIHWSVGGMVMAADTLLGFLHRDLGLNVPDLVVDRVVMSDSLRDTDGDVAEIMNLLVPPAHPKMGYPDFHLTPVDPASRPKVLFISDSYFFNLLGAKIPVNAFANEAFWYYNNSIYPDSWSAHKDTSMIDVPKYVESMNAVVIMVTERFYHRFDWDLTDVLYQHYFPGSMKEYRYDFMRGIVRNYVWFDDIQMQADYSGVPMQEKLAGNADYLFWEADQAGKVPHDIAFYRANILKDPAWMKQIHEKALINKITVDEQITKDAIWMLGESAKKQQ